MKTGHGFVRLSLDDIFDGKPWVRPKRKCRGERDSQKQKVYNAEKEVRPLLCEPELSELEILRLVDRVWNSKRVKSAFPKAAKRQSPDVTFRNTSNAFAVGCSRINLPRGWARRRLIVLHELAHIITNIEYGTAVASHGWQFCETFLKLTLYISGREAHDLLKGKLKAARVRVKEPRKNAPLSEERKAQLRESLARARAVQRAA